MRSYIAEPDRGPRNWNGKQSEKQAVYANRRRIHGDRGKRLQRQRGERIERNFAHQFDTGGLDRLYVRASRTYTQSSYFRRPHAILRSSCGDCMGPAPRAAHERLFDAIFDVLAFIKVLNAF